MQNPYCFGPRDSLEQPSPFSLRFYLDQDSCASPSDRDLQKVILQTGGQRSLDLGDQLFRAEGFLNQFGATIEDSMMHDGIVRVA